MKKSEKKLNRVYFGGSFDILNVGHVKTIKILRKISDIEKAELVVGVTTDELYGEYKFREPIIPFKERKIIIESINGVDMVVPQDEFNMTKNLKKYKVNIFVTTEEWLLSKTPEINYIESVGGKVYILPYITGGMNSTNIKDKIKKVWKTKESSQKKTKKN